MDGLDEIMNKKSKNTHTIPIKEKMRRQRIGRETVCLQQSI